MRSNPTSPTIAPGAPARNRVVYALLTIAVVGLGLASRRYGSDWPFVRAYVGDALWALMIFFGIAFAFNRWSTRTVAVAALGFCFSIEASQLYHAPWIDGIRATRLGGLVLGFGFLGSDLLCYVAGVAVGVLGEYYGISAKRLGRFIGVGLVTNCGGTGDAYLDSSIPRIESPHERIAVVRTKWLNGKLQETTLLDAQNRVLETFAYGVSSQKLRNDYAGNRLVRQIQYYHSDSSEPGFIRVDTSQFQYDAAGRVAQVHHSAITFSQTGERRAIGSGLTQYVYPKPGDTLIRQIPSPEPNSNRVADVDEWRRNQAGQIDRHERLYVLKRREDSRPDTLYYYVQRFAYDAGGRRRRAWFDRMYLGQFYSPAGPDTIRYQYDQSNRLVGELHQYTTDKRNKLEIDTTHLSNSERQSVRWYRLKFFVGDAYSAPNNRTDRVTYRYERFIPNQHVPLQVSRDVYQ